MRSMLGGPSDRQVKLATGIGTAAGAAVALFVIKPFVDIPGFWLGLLAFVLVTGLGGLLGRLVGGQLFRPPSSDPPDPPPHALPGLAADGGALAAGELECEAAISTSYDESDFDEPKELAQMRARMSPQDRIRTFVKIYGREPDDEDELDIFIDEYTLELYNSQMDVGDTDFNPSL